MLIILKKNRRNSQDDDYLNLKRFDLKNNFQSLFAARRCHTGNNLESYQNEFNVTNDKNEIIENKSFRGLSPRSKIEDADSSNNQFKNSIVISECDSNSDNNITRVLEDHGINYYLTRHFYKNPSRKNSDLSSSDGNSLNTKSNIYNTHISMTSSIISNIENDTNKNNKDKNEWKINPKKYNHKINSSFTNDISYKNSSSGSESDEKIIINFNDNNKKSKTNEYHVAQTLMRNFNLTDRGQEVTKRLLTDNIMSSPLKLSKEKNSNKLNMLKNEKISLRHESKDDEEIKFKSGFTLNINKQIEEPEVNLEDERKIILIVDDHKYIRECLKNLLNKAFQKFNLNKSFKIEEAEDGSEIIRRIIEDQYNRNRIKCVITDEHMEFMNGSEAVQFLKSMEKKRKIQPIIFASNSSFENSAMRKHMRDVGFDFFLSKPCSESEVYDFLKECKIIT